MNNKLYLIIYLLLLPVYFIACTGKLTEKEMQNIERYTKQEAHDSLLLGKWMNDETFKHAGKISKIAISFDTKGMNNERMYVEGQPFNDWHLMYYYYTKQGKIFFYRPAEKGFLAMDGELFFEFEYEVSDDGEKLKIDNITYTRIE